MFGRSPLSALVALACLCPAGAAGGGAIELRYSFRAGEAWEERTVHELEISDPAALDAARFVSETTELVEVLSVGRDGAAVLGRRVLSGPGEPAQARGRPSAPVEIAISPRGEVLELRCSPQRAASAGPAARPPAPAGDLWEKVMPGLIARYAPVLPDAPLEEGGRWSRSLKAAFSWGVFEETEEISLAAVERGPLGRTTAVLRLQRRAAPASGGVGTFLFGALLAPAPEALRALPERGAIRGELRGASGEGELRFDIASGRLLSYSMDETLGLGAELVAADGKFSRQVRASGVRTVRVRVRIERLRSL